MSGLRVTGGRLAGRRFRAPSGDTRPTSDRVREALFARLGDLEDQRVLDLFAGSGSLAIEAMSRGARAAVCVERSPGALACIRSNLEALDLARAVRVVPGDVARVLRRLGRQHECFDLALLDPPYASDEAQRAFEALVEASILAPGAVVVLERGRRHLSPQVDGLVQTDERRYGDTVIVRFRVAPSLRTSQ